MNLDLLKQYLKQIEECQLLELLDISSEEIVEMFEERIIERKTYLQGEVEALPMPPEETENDFEDEDYYIEDEFDLGHGG